MKTTAKLDAITEQTSLTNDAALQIPRDLELDSVDHLTEVAEDILDKVELLEQRLCSTTQNLMTASQWEFNGGSTLENGILYIPIGDFAKLDMYLERPVVVEAWMRAEAPAECLSMELFADDTNQNWDGYGLMTGAWGTKAWFWARQQDNQYIMEPELGSSSDAWQFVQMKLTETEVFYNANYVNMATIEDATLTEGYLKFFGRCRPA